MTIFDIQTYLLNFFNKNDSFDLEKDTKKLGLNTGLTKERTTQLVKIALLKMVEAGFISKIEDDVWVLVKPLTHWTQNVTISYLTAEYLANILNSYYQKIDNKAANIDIFNIRDIDIQGLISLFTLITESRQHVDKLPSSHEEIGKVE